MDKLGTTAGESLANLIEGAASTGAGAAIGGSEGALNGAGIASTINEYNKTVFDKQEAAKKAHKEEEWNEAAKLEPSYHENNIYELGYSKDPKTEVWVNGHLNTNAITDEEYHIASTPDEYAMFGAHSDAELESELYEPDSTDLIGIPVVPNNPNNPLTPPLLVFEGTHTVIYGGYTDITQFLGHTPGTYDQAIALGNHLNDTYTDPSYNGPKVSTGGNSMGGALGAIVASITGGDYYVTNSAGVNIFVHSINASSNSINLVAPDEFLHLIQQQRDDKPELAAGNLPHTVVIPAAPEDANSARPWLTEHGAAAMGHAISQVYDPLYNKLHNLPD